MSEKAGRFAIIEQFLADGINYMFGNPGTVEQGFLDALRNYPDFHYITTLQETIAVAMADAYARKTRKPTVVQLHSGVGLGNGIGMLYQAMRGHSPLVVIAGEAGIKYNAMDAQMACDLVSMATPVTKWAGRVIHPDSTLRLLRRAIKMALTPPMAPVFLSLPMDILDAPITEEIRPSYFPITINSPNHNQLQSCVSILANAKKPMILMGDGIAFSSAQNELTKLAELISAEVWGVDSSEVNMSWSHPLFRGLTGHMFGTYSKNIVSQADVVLICGTYVFPDVFPDLGNPLTNAKVIHIDLDSYEIGKNYPVDIAFVSDPKETLAKLAELIKENMSKEQKALAETRFNQLANSKSEALEKQLEEDKKHLNDIPLDPSVFMAKLAKKIPKDTIIFDESLTVSPYLTRYIPPDVPGQFYQTRGGSLGVGIPGAMGIHLADPTKLVIGFTGDGGSMYTIQALWTAVHHKIPAKFVICNNHSYKLLKLNINHYWEESCIDPHPYPDCFDIKNPDIQFAELAKSLGVPGVKVEKPEDIDPAIDKMLATEGPYLIDLVISNQVPPAKVVCKCGQ